MDSLGLFYIQSLNLGYNLGFFHLGLKALILHTQ